MLWDTGTWEPQEGVDVEEGLPRASSRSCCTASG